MDKQGSVLYKLLLFVLLLTKIHWVKFEPGTTKNCVLSSKRVTETEVKVLCKWKMLGDGVQDTLPPKMEPCPIDLKLEKLETTAEEARSFLLLQSVCLVTQSCPTLCDPFFD